MIRNRILVALALLGFASTVFRSASIPPPATTYVLEQPLPITPTPAEFPPDKGGARGFEPGAASDPYVLDLRAEGLLDN